jgi:ribosomal protein S18 acetylase RimI-like enzyme
LSGADSTPIDDQNSATDGLVVRAADSDDQEFLFRVYASTRAEEVSQWGWGAAQKDVFLRMQHNARRSSYAAEYPDAQEYLIVDGGAPIGSMFVNRTADEIRLVDISVLTENRGKGIGARLLKELKSECKRGGMPLRLSVLRGNRAIGLYERLGFRVTHEDQMYIEMEWR